MERDNSKNGEKNTETKTGKTTNSTIESKHIKHVNGASVKTYNPQSRRPSYLPYGSLYPRPRAKENWKHKYKELQKENELLRGEIAQLKEEIQSYRCEQHRLIEKYQDFVEHLIYLRSDNVQIGDHNSQVVHNHYDISLVKDLIGKLEDNIKDDTKKRKLMEDLILDLTSQFENMTELHQADTKEESSDRYFSEMQQLSEHLIDSEMACPVARISQQITDLHGDFTEHCSFKKRVQSTVSLDDRNLTNNENKCECRRKIHSEHNLNVEV